MLYKLYKTLNMEKNIIHLRIANFQIQEKNICHNNTESGRF